MVNPIPAPTSINKSEGWIASYVFIQDMESRLYDTENANLIPCMEGIDMILVELHKLGMIAIQNND